jgi:mannitol-1-phosphate 5-dehydrogenase
MAERTVTIASASGDPDAATAEITGLEPGHPLYAEVRERIASPVYSPHTD